MRLLKQILTGYGLPFGGRVLVAGCREGKLVSFLHGLGYHVDAIDDSWAQIEAARRRFPRFEFQYGQLDQSIPSLTQAFDLVLIQDLCIYRENLFDDRVRSATANLLSCLKAGGDLIVLPSDSVSRGVPSGHHANCWKGHFVCFPGQLEMTEYHESFLGQARWDWLFGAREHGDFSTLRLQTPAEAFDHRFWQERAASGLKTQNLSCCSAAASRTQPLLRSA